MDLKPIESFLISALTEDELRRLCTHLPGGGALALALPGHGIPFAELAHQAVVMLHRQRRLDAAFFEGLCELVPNRAPEIQALTEGVPSPPLPSSTPASAARAAPVQIRQDEITGGVGVQVKDGFAKDVDVAQRVVRGGTGVLLGDD